MTIATPGRMSLEDYLNYDDGTDTRYELVDGVLVAMGNEKRLNEKIALWLIGQFLPWVPLDLIARGTQIAVQSPSVTIRTPDLMVLTETLDQLLTQASQSVITHEMPPPQLAIEVVSPGAVGSENYQRDYVQKPIEYAARGIPEYWIIDPERAVVLIGLLQEGRYQFQAFRGGEAIVSPTFPALNLTASQVLKAGQHGEVNQ